jgi:hypothetical protein
MSEQLELQMRKGPARPDPAELVAFLGGKGWLKADKIAQETGWDDRFVRDLASASDDIISSPGRPGYKLLVEATREEYERYRNGRRSQAREMIAKVIRTDRKFFARPAP